MQTTYLQRNIARLLLIALLLESCNNWNVPSPQFAQHQEGKAIRQKSVLPVETRLEEPAPSLPQAADSRPSTDQPSKVAKALGKVDSQAITQSQIVTSLPRKPIGSPLTNSKPLAPKPTQTNWLHKENPTLSHRTHPATGNRLLPTNSSESSVDTAVYPLLDTPLQWKSREGHQLHKLYVIEGSMYAQVSDQASDQLRYVVPVYVFPGISLRELSTYPMEQIRYYLQILLPTKQERGQVVFSQGGLLGGGKEGDKKKGEGEGIKESKQEEEELGEEGEEKGISSSISLPAKAIATLCHMGKSLGEEHYLATALTMLADKAVGGDVKAQQRLIKKLSKLGNLASLLEKQATLLPMSWREKPLQELQALLAGYYQQALADLRKNQKSLGANEQVAQELSILALQYHYYQLLDPKETGSQALLKELTKGIDQLGLKKLPTSLNLQRIYLGYLVKIARQLDLQNKMKQLQTYMEYVAEQIAKKAKDASKTAVAKGDIIESKALQQLAAKHYRKLGDIAGRLKNQGENELGKSDEWQHSYYLKASKLQDAIATYRLGLLYEKKGGLHENWGKAQQAFEESAQEGYSLAEHKLALQYEQAEDAVLARAWHQRAASQGHPLSLYTLYIQASQEEESNQIEADEEAVDAHTYLVQAAQAGHAQAQHAVGKYYWEQAQYKEAVQWYLQAAEQGIYEAYAFVGVSAAKGLGSKQDFEKALDYYVRAEKIAENAIARYGRARLYEKGKGVVKDVDRALQLYTEASALGYAKAAYHAGRLHLVGEIVGSNPQKAHALLKQAAEGNVYKACLLLGKMQEYGWGGQADLKLAVSWYQRAASKENKDKYSWGQALCQLGWLYRLGKGVAADEATALSYFEQAALVGKEKYVALQQAHEDFTKQLQESQAVSKSQLAQWEERYKQLQEEKQKELIEKDTVYKKVEEELKKTQEEKAKQLVQKEGAYKQLQEEKEKQLAEKEAAYKKLQEAQSHLDATIKAAAPNGEAIVHALANNKTSFSPGGDMFTEVDMAVLVNHPRFKQLIGIDLSSRKINVATLQILVPHLQGLTSLQTLNLYNNQLGDAGVKALAASLAGLTSLQTLSLANNQLGDEGVKALAASLGGLTSLQTLDLYNNQLGDAGVKALAASLGGLTKLQYLYLENNQLGVEGGKALAASLAGLTSLQTLNLDNNQLGDAGVKALAASLGGLTKLQTLDLDNNQLGDAGGKALAASLGGLTSLQELYLENNQLGDAGVKALAASLGGLTSLRELNLDNNQLGDAGVKALAASLKGVPQLEYIYLGNNNIASATQEELKKEYTGITWCF